MPEDATLPFPVLKMSLNQLLCQTISTISCSGVTWQLFLTVGAGRDGAGDDSPTLLGTHSTAEHCTALQYAALHCTALHCTALHFTALLCTALHCTALHNITVRCTALHCTALHCFVFSVLKSSTVFHSVVQCTLDWGPN